MVVFAQNEFIIKGTVTDAISIESLPFANVFVANATFGTSTDSVGNYKLTLPSSGSYDLIISFIGYEKIGDMMPINYVPSTFEKKQ
jgi:hypothetical protein